MSDEAMTIFIRKINLAIDAWSGFDEVTDTLETIADAMRLAQDHDRKQAPLTPNPNAESKTPAD